MWPSTNACVDLLVLHVAQTCVLTGVLFRQMDAGKPGVSVGAGGAGGAAAEGVLASFFNSLLSKKTVQGVPGQPGVQIKPTVLTGDDCECIHYSGWLCDSALAVECLIMLYLLSVKAASSMRSDAAAELDRMTRAQKKVTSENNSLDSSSLNNSTSEC